MPIAMKRGREKLTLTEEDLQVLRNFVRLRDRLVSIILKNPTLSNARLKRNVTKYCLLEKLLLSGEKIDKYFRTPQEKRIYEQFGQHLFLVLQMFSSAMSKVLSRYMKVIVYSYTDLREVHEDLKMEVIIGTIKGLLRLRSSVVLKEEVNPTQLESYIMKVARTHIKDVLPNFVLVTHIPRTCWRKLKDDKNKFVPICIEMAENDTATESGEFRLEELPPEYIVDFDMASIEFRDFVRKLPEPFKSAVLVKLEGGGGDIPQTLINALAEYACRVYREL